MNKKLRSRYTLEFTLEALRQVKARQSAAVVAATLGIADQTTHTLSSSCV